MKTWYVYILTNFTHTVFYTGVTNDLIRRIWEHKSGFIKNSFTSRYRLYKLMWFSQFNDPREAISMEKKIKDFRREKKLKLIAEMNPNFIDLYKTLC